MLWERVRMRVRAEAQRYGASPLVLLAHALRDAEA
jgi:hypothetical protein